MSKVLNVLFISSGKEYYGANRSLFQLICELRELGINPIVLIMGEGEFYKLLKKEKIECIKLMYFPCLYENNARMIFRKKITTLFKIIINKIKGLQIASLLKDKNINLIHSNSITIDIGCYIKQQLHIPHICHLREFGDLDYNLKYPLNIKFRKKQLAKYCDQFIAISKVIQTHFIQTLDLQNITVVYNGININNLLEIRTEDRNNETIQLCVVGAVIESKNQIEPIIALTHFIKKFPNKPIHLNIIGQETNYVNSIKNYIETNSIRNYVTFWGHQPYILPILKHMDIAIMPSKNEAFGRVTIEYMFNKIPVIASNTGANPELIIEGTTGLLYKLGDINELTQKINILYDDHKTRVLISERAYCYAKENFSSEKNTQGVLSIYRKQTKNVNF